MAASSFLLRRLYDKVRMEAEDQRRALEPEGTPRASRGAEANPMRPKDFPSLEADDIVRLQLIDEEEYGQAVAGLQRLVEARQRVCDRGYSPLASSLRRALPAAPILGHQRTRPDDGRCLAGGLETRTASGVRVAAELSTAAS